MKRVNLHTYLSSFIFYTFFYLASSRASTDDEVLSKNKNVESSIAQSHGNMLTNGITYNKKALGNYLSAQIESLTYISSFRKTRLPVDLKIYGSQIISGYTSDFVSFDYKIEEKTIPVYNYKYETYIDEVLVPIDGTGGPAMTIRDPNNPSKTIYLPDRAKKMKKKSVVKERIIKATFVKNQTTIVQTKVYSLKGKHSERIEKPIYKGIRQVDLQKGWYANNAQILYSIIKLGSAKNNFQIEPSINALTHFIINCGIPDNTYDLSWLVALYSNLPQSDATRNKLTIALIDKLIAGCKTTGVNTGMWGAVSVNPHYAYEISTFDQQYLKKTIDSLEDKLFLAKNSGHNTRRLAVALSEKLLVYEKIQELYSKWALSAKTMPHPRVEQLITHSSKGKPSQLSINKIMIPGLDYNVFQYYSTDIESTSIALFALREVKLNKLLPKQVIGPVFQGEKLGKPIHTKHLLTSSYTSIARSFNKASNTNRFLWSFTEHDQCKKAKLNTRYDASIYEEIDPPEDWIHSVMGTASISYLTEILGEKYSSRSSKIYNEITPEINRSIRANILTDVEAFLSDDPSNLYHISTILQHSKSAITTWHDLGNKIAPALNKSLAFDKPQTYTPASTKLIKSTEETALKIKSSTLSPIKFENNDITIHMDMCWRSAFISFIKNQPGIHTHAYWDTTGDFPLSKVFTFCSSVGKKDDKFGSTTKLQNELNIQTLKQTPYLYLGKSLSDADFTINKYALIDYITKHHGILIYDINNQHTHAIVEKTMKSAKIEYDILTNIKSANKYTCFTSKDNTIHAIGMDLPTSSLKGQARVIYNSSLLNKKRAPSIFKQLILSFGKLHIHLKK